MMPGKLIRRELEERGWTQKQLASMLGRPVQAISEIVNGKKSITPETAIQLGEAFGTSAQFWLYLDAEHRLSTHRVSDAKGGE